MDALGCLRFPGLMALMLKIDYSNCVDEDFPTKASKHTLQYQKELWVVTFFRSLSRVQGDFTRMKGKPRIHVCMPRETFTINSNPVKQIRLPIIPFDIVAFEGQPPTKQQCIE